MVPFARLAAGCALLVAACNFQPDVSGDIACGGSNGECPGGLVCCDGLCGDTCAPTTDAGADPDAGETGGDDANDGDLCALAQDAEPPDSCEDADGIDLAPQAREPGGVIVYGDTGSPLPNHLGSPASNCFGVITAGNDAIYRLQLLGGETLRADLTVDDWDSVLYIAAACESGAACLGGQDRALTGDGQPVEQVVYTPAKDEAVYLVVDSKLIDMQLNSTGCYGLEVTVD